jgi:hypothetical protein
VPRAIFRGVSYILAPVAAVVNRFGRADIFLENRIACPFFAHPFPQMEQFDNYFRRKKDSMRCGG